MPESRRQRRARERAERKRAVSSESTIVAGALSEPPPVGETEGRPARVVDVDVYGHLADPDDSEDFDQWSAEFGTRRPCSEATSPRTWAHWWLT